MFLVPCFLICICSIVFFVGLVGFHQPLTTTKVLKQKITTYLPRCSMYGIFAYIWLIFIVKHGKLVGKYTSPMDPQ